MAEELDKLLDEKEEKVPISRVNELSKKVKTAEEEKTQLQKDKEEAEKKASELQKKNEFLTSFADISAKYPNSSEFKADIEAKVMSGYSVEDATVSVLNSKGKLSPQGQTVERVSPAGGSSSNSMPVGGGEKKITDMTRDEKRQALIDAEARGDISLS